MARLTSSRTTGKTNRTVEEFKRDVSSVGYSNMDGTGPSMSLSFPSMTDGDKDRDFRLTLSEADLGQIVRNLFTTSRGFANDCNNPSRRLAYRVMESAGLFFNNYRHPDSTSWHNRDGFAYVVALNDKHAAHQFKLIVKEAFNEDGLEVERDGEWIKLLDIGRV